MARSADFLDEFVLVASVHRQVCMLALTESIRVSLAVFRIPEKCRGMTATETANNQNQDEDDEEDRV